MKFEIVKEFAVRIFMKSALKIQKYSPEILLGLGVGGAVTATVLACHETITALDILEEHRTNREMIEQVSGDEQLCEEENYTPEERKKDIAKLYIQTGLKLAKNYAASAAIMTTSLACIFTGFGILKSRNASLLAAYNAATQAMQAYRKRVKDAVGEEKENDIYANRVEKKVDVTKKDENGNDKVSKEKKKIFSDDPTQYSKFARFFDETNPMWDKFHGNRDLIMQHLMTRQAIFNDRLHSRGVVFFNDILDEFDLPLCQDGWKFGWVDDGKTVIDFGLFNGSKSSVRFVNGYSEAVLMDFNCTYIFDKFEKYQNL